MSWRFNPLKMSLLIRKSCPVVPDGPARELLMALVILFAQSIIFVLMAKEKLIKRAAMISGTKAFLASYSANLKIVATPMTNMKMETKDKEKFLISPQAF
jgi:hypothetical protein